MTSSAGASGVQMGQASNNGTDNLEYSAVIRERLAVPATSGGNFRGGATTVTPYADFQQNYDAGQADRKIARSSPGDSCAIPA